MNFNSGSSRCALGVTSCIFLVLLRDNLVDKDPNIIVFEIPDCILLTEMICLLSRLLVTSSA